MPSNFELFLRLGLACILGGFIGLERERSRHPAGFRTHILVCVGSTLVVLCNLYIFWLYKGQTNIDPGRFGAQVISGIGFLGAGTILKEGVNIKGLTTAASLWAVACLGIAIGLGFYSGAVITTLFILITLIVFSRVDKVFYRKDTVYLRIKSIDKPGQIGRIGNLLGEYGISIVNIKIEHIENELVFIKVRLNTKKTIHGTNLIENLSKIDGISYVEICN